MPSTYDLVVIGTGSAASAVAHRCREAGWTVAVIDSRPFGGTCALRGCDPKKVLLAAAEALQWGELAENGRPPPVRARSPRGRVLVQRERDSWLIDQRTASCAMVGVLLVRVNA